MRSFVFAGSITSCCSWCRSSTSWASGWSPTSPTWWWGQIQKMVFIILWRLYLWRKCNYLLHCFFDALNISFTKLMFVSRKYHASNFHSRCFGVMRSIVNTALRLLLSSAYYYEAIFSVWSGVKCILSRRHSASQLNGRSWEGAGWWSQTDLPVKLLPWLPDHLSLSRLAPCSRHVSAMDNNGDYNLQ